MSCPPICNFLNLSSLVCALSLSSTTLDLHITPLLVHLPQRALRDDSTHLHGLLSSTWEGSSHVEEHSGGFASSYRDGLSTAVDEYCGEFSSSDNLGISPERLVKTEVSKLRNSFRADGSSGGERADGCTECDQVQTTSTDEGKNKSSPMDVTERTPNLSLEGHLLNRFKLSKTCLLTIKTSRVQRRRQANPRKR